MLKENKLDQKDHLAKVDPKGMLNLVATFHEQMKDAYDLGKGFNPISIDGIANICITGLGGSGIGGDLLRCYLSERCRFPILVNRDYTLPSSVNENTLVFVSSYSGNTEETLSAYESAKCAGAKIAAITTGGKLADNCDKDGIPWLKIKTGFSPRAALGYSFMPMLRTVENIGIAPSNEKEVNEAIEVVKTNVSECSFDVKCESNQAKKLALALDGKLAICYAASKNFEVVATRWKGQLNENSKILAMTNVLPEMNHNEIVGWSGLPELRKIAQVVYLRDKGEHPRVSIRFDVMKDIISKYAPAPIEIYSKGEGLLARLFSLINLGDFLSVYLALPADEDPTPVKSIDYLKSKLSER